MILKETHIVPKDCLPKRLSDYVVGIFISKPKKAGTKKALSKGLILVNGKRGQSGYFIQPNDEITLYEIPKNDSKKLNLKLEILFEDEYLAVVYKPAGLLISGNKFMTLTNALPQNLTPSNLPDTTTPQPVHRLDFPTSGLVLCGKTVNSIRILGELFKNKEIQKTYYAITYGKSPKKGYIDLDIDEKKSSSEFEVINSQTSERFDFLNLVKLSPKTGRRHQLRKHLFSIKTPILGDTEYYKEGKILKGNGLYLHAATLNFTHPFTNSKLNVHKGLPKKFTRIFNKIII